MNTKNLALIGLMSAVLCILGPISLPIPISPVPISLGMLGVYLTVYILGMKKGTISVCIYLLLGLVGLPVFTAFGSGIGKVLGPTGGYLLGYIFIALIFGFFIDKWKTNQVFIFLGMILGTAVCYLLGTARHEFCCRSGSWCPAFYSGGFGKNRPHDAGSCAGAGGAVEGRNPGDALGGEGAGRLKVLKTSAVILYNCAPFFCRMEQSIWLIVLTGFAFSLIIESMQYFWGTGISEADDLILNTLGTFIRAMLGRLKFFKYFTDILYN